MTCVTQIGDFLIHTTETQNKFIVRIVVLSVREGYYGELPISFLENGAIALEKSRDEYISEAIRAITTNNGLPNFEYVLEDSVFSWQKILTPTRIRIYFGKIELIKKTDIICATLLCFNIVHNLLSH